MDREQPPILDYRQPANEPEPAAFRLNPLAAVALGVVGLFVLGAAIVVLSLVLYRLFGVE